MKQIILKHLHLVNFKGIRDFEIDFNEQKTSICGRNALGKTTIFDAFTWLLFGKNSEDKKQFSIKTYDHEGNIIPKLPHEVSGIIEVNGEQILLRRTFSENWVKHRGSAEEEFMGHKEERFYNDVPVSVKEWSDKIDAICTEDTFKYITNPLYFTAQDKMVQRDMLFRMAGSDFKDEEIAEGNSEFNELIRTLSGKTLNEYRREIARKKSNIKSEIDQLPSRIDECKRSLPEEEDWVALDEEITAKKAELSGIDSQLNDIVSQNRAAAESRMKIQNDINTLKSKRQEVLAQEMQKVNAEYYKLMAEQKELHHNVELLEIEVKNTNGTIAAKTAEYNQCIARREELIAEWTAINSRQLNFDENEFICPTCKRPLEPTDIEAKQDEMTANFNLKKSEDLKANQAQGKANNDRRDAIKAEIDTLTAQVEEKQSKIEYMKSMPLYTAEFKIDNSNAENLEEIKAIDAEIGALTEELSKPYGLQGNAELTAKKTAVQGELEALTKRMAVRDIIEKGNAREQELTRQLQTQNEELARLEGIELTIARFNRAKVSRIESRINQMFSKVRFKMFDQLINGEEVETCEATVNGTPFSDVNKADRVNAGLDIINTICHYAGVMAPVFIDNSESINELQPIESQIVRLVVTEDTQLVIK